MSAYLIAHLGSTVWRHPQLRGTPRGQPGWRGSHAALAGQRGYARDGFRSRRGYHGRASGTRSRLRVRCRSAPVSDADAVELIKEVDRRSADGPVSRRVIHDRLTCGASG